MVVWFRCGRRASFRTVPYRTVPITVSWHRFSGQRRHSVGLNDSSFFLAIILSLTSSTPLNPPSKLTLRKKSSQSSSRIHHHDFPNHQAQQRSPDASCWLRVRDYPIYPILQHTMLILCPAFGKSTMIPAPIQSTTLSSLATVSSTAHVVGLQTLLLQTQTIARENVL